MKLIIKFLPAQRLYRSQIVFIHETNHQGFLPAQRLYSPCVFTHETNHQGFLPAQRLYRPEGDERGHEVQLGWNHRDPDSESFIKAGTPEYGCTVVTGDGARNVTVRKRCVGSVVGRYRYQICCFIMYICLCFVPLWVVSLVDIRTKYVV